MAKNLKREFYFTLAEVGAELGISRETVRKAEVKALKKLRPIYEARGITPENYLGDDPSADDCWIQEPPIRDIS
jgi:hypothetical protein